MMIIPQCVHIPKLLCSIWIIDQKFNFFSFKKIYFLKDLLHLCKKPFILFYDPKDLPPKCTTWSSDPNLRLHFVDKTKNKTFFYYLDVFVFSHSLFVTFLIFFREKKRNIWNRKMIDERRMPMLQKKWYVWIFAERNTTTYNNERFSMKWTNVTIYLWLLVSWCTLPV